MVDLAGGIEARNYGIRRATDLRHLFELLHVILSAALIAGVLCVYSWTRSQIVNIGYQSHDLKVAEESLLRMEKNLILEEETLKNP